MLRRPDAIGFCFKRLLRFYPAFYRIYASYTPRALQPLARRAYGWLQTRTAKVSPTGALTFDGSRYHAPQVAAEHPLGVNLIGLLRTQNGLGEHARAVRKGLEAAGILLLAKDCSFSGAISEEGDGAPVACAPDKAAYGTNLFCFNPPQIFNSFAEMPAALTQRRYNIGYGYWELPRYPQEWLRSMNLLDEIWAPTQFLHRAISARASRPVVHMPIPLEMEIPPAAPRVQFGLPDAAFLFLFSFDVFSNTARKNPQAAIAAFQQAFPLGRSDVGLVIKVSTHAHMDANRQEAFAALEALAAQDSRVHLVNRMLSRTELSQLMQCCDAYVSLHRAEGLGLGMAESMLLGRPVIATGYSGNMDFTLPAHACLVDYRMIPVGSGEYYDWEGQHWAEPDIAHAAAHMARLAENPEEARALGLKGRAYLRRHFSAQIVGARYRERLELLGLVAKA